MKIQDTVPPKLFIPPDWTPSQAIAAYDLLADLAEIIWLQYEDPILERLNLESERGDCQPDLFDANDPIPF